MNLSNPMINKRNLFGFDERKYYVCGTKDTELV